MYCYYNNGSVGNAYYQVADFTCSHDITPVYLLNIELNREIAIFLIPSILKAGESFEYAKKWRPKRMRKSKLLLPTDKKGFVDFKFMEEFIKQKEAKAKKEILDYYSDKALDLLVSNGINNDLHWKTFKISDVFEIENCKCSKVSGIPAGDIPYIGATNRNNGVISFIERRENLITKGNCIVFICDGEGSIGYSIYKREDFIGTTTVKVGRNKNLNKFSGILL